MGRGGEVGGEGGGGGGGGATGTSGIFGAGAFFVASYFSRRDDVMDEEPEEGAGGAGVLLGVLVTKLSKREGLGSPLGTIPDFPFFVACS